MCSLKCLCLPKGSHTHSSKVARGLLRWWHPSWMFLIHLRYLAAKPLSCVCGLPLLVRLGWFSSMEASSNRSSWQAGYEAGFINQKHTAHKFRLGTSGSKDQDLYRTHSDTRDSSVKSPECACENSFKRGVQHLLSAWHKDMVKQASVPSRGSLGIHQASSSEQSSYWTAAKPGRWPSRNSMKQDHLLRMCSLQAHRSQVQRGFLCTCFIALLLPFRNSWDSLIRRPCTFILFDLWKLSSQFHCNPVNIPQAEDLTFYTDKSFSELAMSEKNFLLYKIRGMGEIILKYNWFF